MNKRPARLWRGFTLIELMITIAIIAILSSFGIFTYRLAQARARDARRKSDLGQYKNALEIYANKNNGFYPSYTTQTGASTTLCAALGLTSCPEDPIHNTNGNYIYNYQSDGTNGGTPNGTKYLLWAKEEVSSNSWVFCSNGKSGELANVSTGSPGDCPSGL